MRHYLSLLIMVTLSALPAHGEISCPKNWMKLGGSCYRYFNTPMTFYSAQNYCEKEARAELVSIHSSEEFCAISKYVASSDNKMNVWIGLHDPSKKRVFRWIDGSRFNFEGWAPRQPDNHHSKEYCVEVFRHMNYLGWNDISCETTLPFICQFTPHTKFSGCK